MAHSRSAWKRVRKATKARTRNVEVKDRIKASRRGLFESLAKKDKENSQKLFKQYCSVLDKSAKRGIITRNTAMRRKARAAQKLQAL